MLFLVSIPTVVRFNGITLLTGISGATGTGVKINRNGIGVSMSSKERPEMATRGLWSRCVVLAMMAILPSGCSTFHHAIPAYCIGPDGPARSDQEPINFLRLRREPPDAYQLGPRDVLGIYIEGVLGSPDEPPPVHFPEGEDLPPAIGFPVPVREDGTISLPLILPFRVEGFTLAQAEQRIRAEYTSQERQILRPGKDRIIVTLMRPRTYHVLVVREDTGATTITGSNPKRMANSLALGITKRGLTHAVELRAYENDVLHALSATGGLPGVDAKNEVTVLRGAFSNPGERDQLLRRLDEPVMHDDLLGGPNVVKIPLRLGTFDPPLELSEEQITLYTGDIVFVESRETEVYYTGGLLPAGQFPLPRDYDIDVIEAIAMAGGSVATGAVGNDDAFHGRGGVAIGAIFPPTRAIVLRKINGEHVPIAVNLKRAMLDPEQRIRILPGDFITLQYTPGALLGNIAVSTFRLNFLVGDRL
jgi:protein involved in polysaccharide export with SLBB domain